MSVLIHTQIEALAQNSQLITPFDLSGLQGASYDMRLGEQYSTGGVVKVLSKSAPSFTILPGEFALLSTHETLKLPKSLIGHNGIMSPWAKRGLVSLFSPQIDPGFIGILVVPVFNAGDSPISLTLGDRIFTVEFMETSQPTEYGWSERNHVQDKISSLIAPPNAFRSNGIEIQNLATQISSIASSLKNIENNQRELTSRLHLAEKTIESHGQLRATYIGLVVAILGIFFTMITIDSSSIRRFFTGSSADTAALPTKTSSPAADTAQINKPSASSPSSR